jgi:hypothetical protein
MGFAWDIGGKGAPLFAVEWVCITTPPSTICGLFERADLGRPGSELFLIGTDLRSPLLPGGDGRFSLGQLTLAQALAIVPGGGAPMSNIASQAALSLPVSNAKRSSDSRPRDHSSRQSFRSHIHSSTALGCSGELPWKMLLQADYNYRKGVHEVFTYDANHFFDLNGGPRTAFPNSVPYADSSGFSTYQAMLLAARPPFLERLSNDRQLRSVTVQGVRWRHARFEVRLLPI